MLQVRGVDTAGPACARRAASPQNALLTAKGSLRGVASAALPSNLPVPRVL
jgi:hypothetical protein